MEVKLAVPIILLALLLGVALSLVNAEKINGEWLQGEQNGQDNLIPNQPAESEEDRVHEHALMYVSMNNSTLNFLEGRYQMAANRVHFENKVPHVVHKHQANVTWQEFLRTLNATLEHENGTTYCGEFKNYSYCGEGIVQLNGEKVTDLNKEIHQDDKLIIILQPGYEERLGFYEDQELPEIFREREVSGREV